MSASKTEYEILAAAILAIGMLAESFEADDIADALVEVAILAVDQTDHPKFER